MPVKTAISEVPLLDLNAQYDGIREEVKEAIHHVLESQYFIMGPEVSSFEQEVAAYCGSEHAIGCASGSDALLLSLMALNVEPGDAVITTPFTFFATAGAIARLGAVPVFLDIDPITYNIDSKQVELFLEGEHPLNKKLDLYAGDIKAIIPVHLYGQMADMDPLIDVAEKYDIKVIEDAAQAIGSEYKGKRAGTLGNLGCFSFFPSKNLGGYGDGGLVTTDDAEMAEKLGILRLHGAHPKYHHKLIGINSRLDALQAAILKVKLKYLDTWSEARREKAMNYNRLFEEAGLAGNREELAYLNDHRQQHDKQGKNGSRQTNIFCPCEVEGAPEKGGRHIYHQYVIRIDTRKQIMDAFKANNIGCSIYYPVPLHEQECFAYLGYEASDCAVSSYASKTTLALPIYPEITDRQQEYVVDTMKDTIKNL